MYDLVSFVARGSVRKKVLKALLRPNSPTELARTLDIERSTVSRTILALVDVGLVECLTPDEKMDRYYRVTETGEKVAEIIEGMGK
jgi:DNA-binding MarR family transcriptional regulator